MRASVLFWARSFSVMARISRIAPIRRIFGSLIIKNIIRPTIAARYPLREKVRNRAMIVAMMSSASQCFCFVDFVWYHVLMVIGSMNPRNPAMKFGSIQVPKSLPMCGSQPPSVEYVDRSGRK